jgi:hypothetical protein
MRMNKKYLVVLTGFAPQPHLLLAKNMLTSTCHTEKRNSKREGREVAIIYPFSSSLYVRRDKQMSKKKRNHQLLQPLINSLLLQEGQSKCDKKYAFKKWSAVIFQYFTSQGPLV